MVNKTSKKIEDQDKNPLMIIGLAVKEFMERSNLKSGYVRSACHMGSSRFVFFKKAS